MSGESSGENMAAEEKSRKASAFDGYYRKQTADPDLYLCGVGRGTPGGEYLRRFWHPIAYLSELGELPLRVRALGEDLVAFRDGRGEVGVLHLHCCHRNTSLEYGIVEPRGIRCCYHGRLFDTDGTLLEIPGDPAEGRLKSEVSQGGYPTYVFNGIVFTYMGPPERVPVFPHLDRFDIPGITLIPGVRLTVECNWVQIKENVLDPHHTNILHTIPQRRGVEHFADEFESAVQFSFMETPGGFSYLGARKVGGNIWVRSAESFGPNIHCISSIFESGKVAKAATPPFLTFWTLPVDDSMSINFFLSHVSSDETMPFEKRRALEIFGQINDRPYKERQFLPGDHEAQTGQGPINVHALEHLGSFDRGIALFRRYVRQGIKAVERGGDPKGFYLEAGAVPPTFASDRVIPISQIEGDPESAETLIAVAEQVGRDYLREPPIAVLKSGR
jgi:phenylpropionate dioxygenase-like ring-hydroxylating dioxygenase large terminal subunit